MPHSDRFTRVVAVGLLCIFMARCGSGTSSTGSGSPPPNPSFVLSLSPANITLTQGGAGQPLQVSIAPQNGFIGTVSVTMTGFPAGVTVAPSSLSVTSSSPGNFTLSASQTAGVSQQSVSVNAVSGALNVVKSIQLTVTGTASPDPFHPVGGSMVHGFFDESRQLLFATNIGLNELDVISPIDFSVQARVSVPQPLGIDQMADGKTLVIGTAAQELITVDEATLAVTQHPFSAAAIGGFTLFFPTVVALANGQVIVIGQEEGIDSSDIVDGGQFLYIWDSNANTFTQFEPTGNNPSWETDSLSRSADHKWAVFSGDQFYLYSSDSDSLTSAPFNAVNPPDNTFGVRGYAINANGSEIAVVSATQVTFLNNSLAVLGTTPIPGAFQTARTTVQFSADGSKLYLQYDLPLEIEEIDAASFTALGYLSATVFPDDDNLERLLATDSQGHAYLGIDGGVRFVDLTQSPVPNGPNGNLQVPNCPVLDDSLPLNMSMQQTLTSTFTGVSLFVGGQAAPLLNGGTTISIPSSSAVGPVDVVCIDSSGNTAVYADGVSYGVDPVGFNANLLPPTGNPAAFLFGFGFAGQAFETPTINIGGQPATNVTALQDLEPGVTQGDAFQIPNGSPGEAATISVSSSDGSGTLSSAATYYAAPTIVPATGLLQLLYDSHRSLIYALKATEIDVLDPETLQWKSPLSFPATATGTYSIMALTPDGSKLVVEGLSSSSSPQVIVLDPDGISPPAVVTYTGSGSVSGSITITASNQAILSGLEAVVLDLSSLTFTPLNVSTGTLIRSSPDGLHIFGADLNISSGTVYSINPSTLAVQKESFGELFWEDLAVSPGGGQFATVTIEPGVAGDSVGFFDPALHYLNTNVYPEFSPPDDSGATGATFSPGGKVLVVPLGDSIEFWDAAMGTLRARLMTPEELKVMVFPELGVAPVLALDPAGQTIYTISASGVTVIKMAQPLDQIPSMQWPQARIHDSRLGTFNGLIASRMAAMHGTPRR
jgi:hypothetical protein